MKWYCEYLNGRHSELAKKCAFRDRETSEGAALTTNGGKAGAWYINEEIDTRPTTYVGWKEINTYACNCKCENNCPVRKAIQREIDEFVNAVMAQGLDVAWHICRELYHYIMTRNNPMGAVYPRDIQLPYEYVDEAHRILREQLMRANTYGHIANNYRQPT